MSEPTRRSAGRHSAVVVGVMSMNDEIYPALISAVIEAELKALPVRNVDLTDTRTVAPDIIVIGAKWITSELLAFITEAAAATSRRFLLVADDRDPQRIADLLHSGADDYLATPFAPEELVARILSLASRSSGKLEQCAHEQIGFDFPTRTVFAGAVRVPLSRQEWNILLALLEAEQQPISVKELSDNLSYPVNEGAIVTTIARLRRRFREHGFNVIAIDTVYGKGYEARFRRSADADVDADLCTQG